MAEELTRQEQKALMADAKSRGMNRSDRKKFLSAIRSGDEGALKAAETNVFKPYASTSANYDESKRAEGSRTDEQSRERLFAEPTKFRVSGSMEEFAQVEAGLGGIDASVLSGKDNGGAFLYDDATGKLYRTQNWKDVQRNSAALVSKEGKRQRVAGAMRDSGAAWNEDRTIAVNPGGSGPGGIDIVYGYDEDVPAPGTEEFRKWMNDKFDEGRRYQGNANRYSKDKGGTGTSYGQYGSITASDWIALGRPKVIGNDLVLGYDDLSGYADDEIRGDFILYTQDREKRSHGIEKGLNSVGASVGFGRLGSEALGALDTLGDVGLLVGGIGPIAKVVSSSQEAYSASRDAGKSAGSSMKSAEKAGGYAAAESAIDTVQQALVSAAIATAWTGVGGAGFGAAAAGAAAIGAGLAAGAAAGYGAGLAEYGVHSSIYGGYDSGDMLKTAEKKGAAGAISGGVQGAGMAFAPSAGSGPWFGFAEHPVQTGAAMAAKSAESYAISTAVYGNSGWDAERGALLSGLSVVAPNAVGQVGAQADSGIGSLLGRTSDGVVQPTAGYYSGMVQVDESGNARPQFASPFANETATSLPSNWANLRFGQRVASLSGVFRNEVASRAYSGSRIANAMPSSLFLRHVVGAGTETRRSQQYLGQTGAAADAQLALQRGSPTSDLRDPLLSARVNYGGAVMGSLSPIPSMAQITGDAQQRIRRAPVAWWDAFAYPKGSAPNRSEKR